jgi:starch phosphorylase
VPLFYERDLEGIPRGWVAMVKASMTRLTPRFNSARMMREYAEKIYRPATAAYRNRIANGAKLADELAGWQKRINEGWAQLRFGRLSVSREGEFWRFSVEVYLGQLAAQDVRVQLYADPLLDEGEKMGWEAGQKEERQKDGGYRDDGLKDGGLKEGGSKDQNGPERIVMAQQGPLPGAINGFIYRARVAAKRSAEDYTPRIVPYHKHAFIPLEEAHILWMR